MDAIMKALNERPDVRRARERLEARDLGADLVVASLNGVEALIAITIVIVAVIGASSDRSKFSNKAVRAYIAGLGRARDQAEHHREGSHTLSHDSLLLSR